MSLCDYRPLHSGLQQGLGLLMRWRTRLSGIFRVNIFSALTVWENFSFVCCRPSRTSMRCYLVREFAANNNFSGTKTIKGLGSDIGPGKLENGYGGMVLMRDQWNCESYLPLETPTPGYQQEPSIRILRRHGNERRFDLSRTPQSVIFVNKNLLIP